MNHTHYFKDEELYNRFIKQAKSKTGSVSKALNEAMSIWLNNNKKWSKGILNMKPITDDFSFEKNRSDITFNNHKEIF